MKEIKNPQTKERQDYVTASIKVIRITSSRVLCVSNPLPGKFDGNDPWNPTY